jgi:Tol biopolymer transport system component
MRTSLPPSPRPRASFVDRLVEALGMRARERAVCAVLVAGVAAAAPAAAEAFPGENGAIAYAADRGPGQPSGDVYVELPWGGTLAVAHQSGVGFTHPRWSADGKRLLLTGGTAADGRQLWIAQVEVSFEDGSGSVSGLRRLTTPGSGENADGTWSPDGRHVAYVHTPATGGAPQVWRMRADGTQRRQLAWSRLGTADPDWSPDGRRIAFTTWPTNAADRGPRLFTMDAHDGTDKRKVTVTPGRRPAWSPDGRRLAFEDPHGKRLQTIRADGLELRSVLTVPANRTTELSRARWAPDATQLLYTWDNSRQEPIDPASVRSPAFASLDGREPFYPIVYGDDADWQPQHR